MYFSDEIVTYSVKVFFPFPTSVGAVAARNHENIKNIFFLFFPALPCQGWVTKKISIVLPLIELIYSINNHKNEFGSPRLVRLYLEREKKLSIVSFR